MLAAIYNRISDDKEGQALGVERQLQDNLKLAERLGLTVGHVYTDNDIGASTLSRKARPDYQAMVKAVRAGTFTHVLAYSNSRLTRRPMELEEWIALHDETGVEIHTVASGSDDLSTADGRMVARIKASVDAAEAERTGERVARKHRERQESGKPAGGPRPFGFMADRTTHNPHEVDALRWAMAHILHGGNVSDVVRKWNGDGLFTSLGSQWGTTTVTQVLQNPRLKGVRARWVKVKGRQGHWENVLDGSGRPVSAVWAPVVPPEQFDAVQAILEERRARRALGDRPSNRYLLTPFLRCGNCGGRMRAVRTKTTCGYSYSCNPRTAGGCGEVSRVGDRVDALVETAVLAALDAIVRRSEAIPVPEEAPPDFSRLDGLLADAHTAWKAGDLPSADYFALRNELAEERRALERKQAESAKKSERTHNLVDAPARWGDATLADKQALLSELLTAVVIDPLPVVDGRKVRGWNPELVQIVWRDA